MNFWAFWSTNSGGVGGFVAQETKNLKKCDLDLNKWGGYIKGGIYDKYNGIPPCGTIVLEGNFSLWVKSEVKSEVKWKWSDPFFGLVFFLNFYMF